MILEFLWAGEHDDGEHHRLTTITSAKHIPRVGDEVELQLQRSKATWKVLRVIWMLSIDAVKIVVEPA
jgi:hypothetical protein